MLADNLREMVQLARVTQGLAAAGHDVFVEISPHPIQAPAIEDNARAVAGWRGNSGA